MYNKDWYRRKKNERRDQKGKKRSKEKRKKKKEKGTTKEKAKNIKNLSVFTNLLFISLCKVALFLMFAVMFFSFEPSILISSALNCSVPALYFMRSSWVHPFQCHLLIYSIQGSFTLIKDLGHLLMAMLKGCFSLYSSYNVQGLLLQKCMLLQSGNNQRLSLRGLHLLHPLSFTASQILHYIHLCKYGCFPIMSLSGWLLYGTYIGLCQLPPSLLRILTAHYLNNIWKFAIFLQSLRWFSSSILTVLITHHFKLYVCYSLLMVSQAALHLYRLQDILLAHMYSVFVMFQYTCFVLLLYTIV